MSGLIWVQTVCKSYQQKALGDKEFSKYNKYQNFVSWLNCFSYILKYMLWVLQRTVTLRQFFLTIKNSCDVLKMLSVVSAAYIQVHFRLDFSMEANNMNPDQTWELSVLGPYCLKYRLPKNISR